MLPPGYQDYPDLDLYAYIYRYDYLDRLVYKKLPGCSPSYLVYDAAHRLVFSQDGCQRNDSLWSFFVYDVYGRVVVEGECGNSDKHVRTAGETVVLGTLMEGDTGLAYSGYQSSFDLVDPCVYVVNYYDTYDFRTRNGFSAYNFPEGTVSAIGNLTGSIFCTHGSSGFIYSADYYDSNKRIVKSLSSRVNGGMDTYATEYSFQGSPLSVLHTHTDSSGYSLTERYTYTYDHSSRLTRVSHQYDNNPSVLLVEHTYDELGRLQTDKLDNGIYATDYAYNIRNWLTGIEGSKFSQSLHYTDGLGVPCYNGNISSMTWKSGAGATPRGYKFSYDRLGRLTDAEYGEGPSLSVNTNRFNEQVTGYDKMGNILGLKRYGQTSATGYDVIDDLSLSYAGNRLKKVADRSGTSTFNNGFEFKDGIDLPTEYEYDENGNLTKDLNKNITEIQYNILNLPSHIRFAGGSSIVYEYAADGSKIRTTHTINDNVTSTVYCGNAVYENGSLKILLNESGYYSFQDNRFHFYIKDHQGNVRVVADETGKVDEVNDYYPFGGLMSNACNNTQPYKYNGKELDRKGGLDWYDYGARYYDPLIGMFLSVDPLSENFYSVNPYAYCLSNPFNRIDPTGMSSRYNWKTKRYEDEDGNEVSWEEVRAEYQLDGMSSPAVDGLNDWGLSNETDDGGNVDAISGAAPKVTSLKIIEPNATTVIPVVMPWKSLAGEAFGNIISRFIGPAFLIFTLQGDSSPAYVKEAKDSSNNEKHGDGGRTLSKDEKRIKDLKQKIDRSPNKKEKQALKKKLQNIKRNGEKQREGEEHSRTRKR